MLVASPIKALLYEVSRKACTNGISYKQPFPELNLHKRATLVLVCAGHLRKSVGNPGR